MRRVAKCSIPVPFYYFSCALKKKDLFIFMVDKSPFTINEGVFLCSAFGSGYLASEHLCSYGLYAILLPEKNQTKRDVTKKLFIYSYCS